jgi:hypothetical protein
MAMDYFQFSKRLLFNRGVKESTGKWGSFDLVFKVEGKTVFALHFCWQTK